MDKLRYKYIINSLAAFFIIFLITLVICYVMNSLAFLMLVSIIMFCLSFIVFLMYSKEKYEKINLTYTLLVLLPIPIIIVSSYIGLIFELNYMNVIAYVLMYACLYFAQKVSAHFKIKEQYKER